MLWDLGRIRSLSDMTSCLFLSTVFLQYEQLSKRFMPETINLLVNTAFIWLRIDSRSSLPSSFSAPDFRLEPMSTIGFEPQKGPSWCGKAWFMGHHVFSTSNQGERGIFVGPIFEPAGLICWLVQRAWRFHRVVFPRHPSSGRGTTREADWQTSSQQTTYLVPMNNNADWL